MRTQTTIGSALALCLCLAPAVGWSQLTRPITTQLVRKEVLASPVGYAMYLKVSGQRSGAIKGDVTKPGHTDTIGVLRFQEGDVSPRDPQSGLPTGKITHKPFVIVKELDKASPLLFNALVANETLTSFIFDIFQLDNRGVETLAKSITLSGASVASWTHRKVRDEAGKVREVEEVSFTYQAMDGAIKPATILRRPLPMIKTVKP